MKIYLKALETLFESHASSHCRSHRRRNFVAGASAGIFTWVGRVDYRAAFPSSMIYRAADFRRAWSWRNISR